MSSIIVAFVVLAVTARMYRTRRRRPDDAAASDIPTVVVGWAAGLMPVGREQWGQAMLGELGQYTGFARWRFALGCTVAALGVPRRTGEKWAVGSVLAASIASAGLVAYGTIRYPGMVTGTGTWLAVAAFGAVLVGFVVVTAIAARPSPIGVSGVVGGCALAGVWIVVGTVAVSARSTVSMLLLLILPMVSIAAGVFGARRGRTRAAGRRTVVVSAVVAALVVFIVLTADTLITGGRPYDAGQLQDFAASGYPDMATYAVSDDLGTAMVLLLLHVHHDRRSRHRRSHPGPAAQAITTSPDGECQTKHEGKIFNQMMWGPRRAVWCHAVWWGNGCRGGGVTLGQDGAIGTLSAFG